MDEWMPSRSSQPAAPFLPRPRHLSSPHARPQTTQHAPPGASAAPPWPRARRGASPRWRPPAAAATAPRPCQPRWRCHRPRAPRSAAPPPARPPGMGAGARRRRVRLIGWVTSLGPRQGKATQPETSMHHLYLVLPQERRCETELEERVGRLPLPAHQHRRLPVDLIDLHSPPDQIRSNQATTRLASPGHVSGKGSEVNTTKDARTAA